MHIRNFILILLVSASAFGQIRNYHQLTEQIFRSAAPGKDTLFLAKAGFTHVLIFKNELKNEVAQEINDLLKIGIQRQNIYNIPFAWKDMGPIEDSCDQVIMALDYLAQVEKSKTNKILFHCSIGEDRTGALAGLYRMLYNGWTLDKAFQEEMCANGYEAGDKGKPMSVVNSVRNEVTPVFLAVASLILQKKISFNNLNRQVCHSGDLKSPVVQSLINQKSKYICN